MLTSFVAPVGTGSGSAKVPTTSPDAVFAAARKAQLAAHVSTFVTILSLVVHTVLLSLWQTPATDIPAQQLQAEGPPVKSLAPNRQYVSLENLAIYQDHIAEGAVGTPELKDHSVTQSKLAVGSVTSSAIAAGAVSFETLSSNAVEQLSTEVLHTLGNAAGALLGEVSGSGDALSAGISVERTSAGEYLVSFTTHFAAKPVVVVSAQAYATCYCPRSQITTRSVVVHCMSALLTSTPSFFDTGFSFYAAVTS